MKLKNLKVKSFVTASEELNTKTVKGGGTWQPCGWNTWARPCIGPTEPPEVSLFDYNCPPDATSYGYTC